MSNILTAIGQIFTSAMEWVGDIGEMLISTTTTGTGSEAVTTLDHPILLLFAVLPLVGLGVGLFKRLINVN